MRTLLKACALIISLCGVQTATAFDFEVVVEKARDLAAKPYAAPIEIPRFLRELNYDEYQNIRFDPEQSLWRDSNAKFQVLLTSPGLFYTHPVAIHIIDAEGMRPLPYRKSYFTFADPELEKRIPPDLGYAGFKLSYPLSGNGEQNQFLVFAGASYFRAVGKRDAWGLSGRGIAVNTGLPSGEEFPSFTHFWLERPAPNARNLRLYGLLDGKSLTGAYQFVVTPGETTQLQVEAVLFPRGDIPLIGIAPLTSMFFFGENTPRPPGEWRPEVHDSDGLLINDGASGEWLWRPLLNPQRLEMDYLKVEALRGFGLLQRDRDFDHYQDLGALYDQRPGAWVKPKGDWGPGKVVLVQLPTPAETNDNIVAFWTPDKSPAPNKPYRIAYDLSFGRPDVTQNPMGKAINSFLGDGGIVGGGNVAGAYRVIVDFQGGPLDKLKPGAPVTATVSAQEGGEMIEHFVEYNAPLRAWRLSMLAKPAEGKPLELRAFLSEGERTLTETWAYRLPSGNGILSDGKRR